MAALYDDSGVPSPAKSQFSSYPHHRPPSATGSRVVSHQCKTLEGFSTPYTLMTEWSYNECADFLANLGLKQYCQAFIDNAIVGEALIALSHEDLKEMGIRSAGHRLTILKTIYELKILQGIPLEPDHFIPPSSTASLIREKPVQTEFARLLQSIHLRDDRTSMIESELRKLSEEYRRLREDFLPLLKMSKELKQPLPNMPSSPFPSMSTNNNSHRHPPPPPLTATDSSATSPTPTHEKLSNSLTRTLSKKLFSSSSNSNSRNHPPLTAIHQQPSPIENKDAFGNGAHSASQQTQQNTTLHFAPNMSGQISPSLPSSSSSIYNQAATPRPNFLSDHHSPNRVRFPPPTEHNDTLPSPSRATPPALNSVPNKPKNSSPGSNGNPSNNGRQPGDSNNVSNNTSATSEGTKSFRVTLDDPCYKVLPAAMKKYNISDDWRLYALYIVYGKEERCLAMDERPLILFKQLDKEGKNPMFMLRKQPQYGGGTVIGGDTHSGSGALTPGGSASQDQGVATTGGATGINILPNTGTPPEGSGFRSHLNASSSPNVSTSAPTAMVMGATTAATSNSTPASSTHTPPSGMI